MSDEHIVKLGELDGGDGDWLGIRDGDTVALTKLGVAEGRMVGNELGVRVVGNLLGLYDGKYEGQKEGEAFGDIVGNVVGALVLGLVWHIDGELAVHKALYILLLPDIATQSLPVTTTGKDDLQNVVGSTGTEPSFTQA